MKFQTYLFTGWFILLTTIQTIKYVQSSSCPQKNSRAARSHLSHLHPHIYTHCHQAWHRYHSPSTEAAKTGKTSTAMQMVKQLNRNMLKETEDKFLEQNNLEEDLRGVQKVCHAWQTDNTEKENRTWRQTNVISLSGGCWSSKTRLFNKYRFTYLGYI